MSWLRGPNTTIGTPIPLNGPGPIRRCVLVRETCPVNSVQVFVPSTLGASLLGLVGFEHGRFPLLDDVLRHARRRRGWSQVPGR